MQFGPSSTCFSAHVSSRQKRVFFAVNRVNILHSVVEVRRILQMSEPSDHKKFMLRIAKLLSREDVDDILYLSEDCTQTAGSVSSGVDLMRSLERDGKLGTGNYTYLLSCLREIGRIDLERSLKKSLGMGDDDTLPFLPPSFSAINQLLVVKISSLQHKRGLFISSMCCITDLKNNHQGYNPRWSPFIEQMYTCFSSSLTTAQVLPESCKITKVLVTTLDQISQMLPWRKAIGEFMQHQDHSKIADCISELATHSKMFHSALDSIGWRSEWCSQKATELSKIDPLNCASPLASSTVCELASELLGESKLQEASKHLNAAITTVESIIYIARHKFVVMHWLTTLMEFAAYCSVDLQSYRDSLRSIFKAGVATYNWAFLRWVLCGTKLLDKIESEGLVDQDASSCMTPGTLTLHEPMLPVVLPLTLMALLYSEEFTPQDWLLIRARISNHFKDTKVKVAVVYSKFGGVAASMVHKELDHYIQQSVNLFGTEVGPAVKELAVAFFQY